MKILSTLLIVVGIAWALFEAWLSAGMDAIADWKYSVSIIAWLVTISPWALIVGPILVVAGWLPKVGVVLALAGCIALTGEAVCGLIGAFEIDFSHGKPLYVLFSCVLLITLLADAAAFRLVQLIWFARVSQPH